MFCGGNCQYDSDSATRATRPKPSSLLIAAPCYTEVLQIRLGSPNSECFLNFTRNEDGYFNISVPKDEFGNPNDPNCQFNTLSPRVRFFDYGDPPYDEVTCPVEGGAPEFCAQTGSFEIHTSCSYEIFIGQLWGPQQDMIIAGYCQSNGGGEFAGCAYYEEENPYVCYQPSSTPSLSNEPTRVASSRPSLVPSQSSAPTETLSARPSLAPSVTSRPSNPLIVSVQFWFWAFSQKLLVITHLSLSFSECSRLVSH